MKYLVSVFPDPNFDQGKLYPCCDEYVSDRHGFKISLDFLNGENDIIMEFPAVDMLTTEEQIVILVLLNQHSDMV